MTTVTDLPAHLADPIAVAGETPTLGQRLMAAYELTKPRLNFLVVVTTVVGCYMAAGAGGLLEQPWLFLNALVGTALTAAGSGVLNQFLERDADGRMPRTRRRPLPLGQVSPTFALVQGLLLGLIGTAWLAIFVNTLTAGLGLFTLLMYVLVYTPLKRRTSLCTLVGALPGAVPPVMGFTAFDNAITPGAWALFAILFIWQMPHFYGLAIVYRDDYAAGGFAMLPTRRNGMSRTARQIVGYLLLMLPASVLPTFVGLAGWGYGIAAVVLSVWFLGAGLRTALTHERADARRLFFVSILYLPLLLGMMMLDKQ